MEQLKTQYLKVLQKVFYAFYTFLLYVSRTVWIFIPSQPLGIPEYQNIRKGLYLLSFLTS